jgi:ribonuclease HII
VFFCYYVCMQGSIGIDEVGRGAWAGPLLVVAARQIQKLPTNLKDSKQTTKRQRHLLVKELLLSCQFGEGWVSSVEIDMLGLTLATKTGVKRALSSFLTNQDVPIVMDGHINYCPDEFTNVQCTVKADMTVPIVSAASVYAKVMRDMYMQTIGKEFPNYLFENHVGYGTAVHKKVLEKYGLTTQHRRSFKPVRQFL